MATLAESAVALTLDCAPFVLAADCYSRFILDDSSTIPRIAVPRRTADAHQAWVYTHTGFLSTGWHRHEVMRACARMGVKTAGDGWRSRAQRWSCTMSSSSRLSRAPRLAFASTPSASMPAAGQSVARHQFALRRNRAGAETVFYLYLKSGEGPSPSAYGQWPSTLRRGALRRPGTDV